MTVTLIPVQMCSQMAMQDFAIPSERNPDKYYNVHYFDEAQPWSCDCPSYIFRPKYKAGRRWCKHLQWVDDNVCQYHEQFDGVPDEDGVCPKCGEETITVEVRI